MTSITSFRSSSSISSKPGISLPTILNVFYGLQDRKSFSGKAQVAYGPGAVKEQPLINLCSVSMLDCDLELQ
jgi:hypothetical protein